MVRNGEEYCRRGEDKGKRRGRPGHAGGSSFSLKGARRYNLKEK